MENKKDNISNSKKSKSTKPLKNSFISLFKKLNKKKRKFNIRSIKYVLSMVINITFVILICILVTISYFDQYNNVKASYIDQLKNISKSTSNKITEMLESELKTTQFFSKHEDVINSIENEEYSPVSQLFTLYSEELGRYENISLSTAEEKSEIVAAANSATIGSTLGKKETDNVNDALKGSAYIGKVKKSESTGRYKIYITAPVLKDLNTIGIIGISYDFENNFQKLAEEVKIGKTGNVFILNEDGIVIAHPDKTQLKSDYSKNEWYQAFLQHKSGEVFDYFFNDESKITVQFKDENQGLICVSSINKSEITSAAMNSSVNMLIFGIIIALAGGLLSLVLITLKLKPLDKCRDVIVDLAGGNVSTKYTGKITKDEVGEIARSVNDLSDNMKKIVNDLLNESTIMTNSANRIKQATGIVVDNAHDQASSTEEIAAALEEMEASISQNTESSKKTNTIAHKTSEEAKVGAKEVVNTVKRIKDISKKILSVEEIASQTNLLALNAAMESVRAGSASRGFAVVATEIRSLAEKSQELVKEITQLATGSVAIAENAGKIIDEVVPNIVSTATLVSSITQASEEQNVGVDQINISMEQLNKMTQENSASSIELTEVANELSQNAEQLQDIMKFFKVDEQENISTVE